MKSLKITLLAIFSVALLTAVSQYKNDTTPNTKNPEVKKVETTLIALHKKKGVAVPTQS